jgi:hypothetical protein
MLRGVSASIRTLGTGPLKHCQGADTHIQLHELRVILPAQQEGEVTGAAQQAQHSGWLPGSEAIQGQEHLQQRGAGLLHPYCGDVTVGLI